MIHSRNASTQPGSQPGSQPSMTQQPLSARRLQSACAQSWESLAPALPAGSSAMRVVVHERIASTSDWLLQQIGQGEALPLACFAEQQTRGRGRRGKHWLQVPYSNIAMSLGWRFAADEPHLQLLGLNVAMALVDVLEAIGIREVQVKWPNDVYVSGRKIAGILIDTRVRAGSLQAVIGVGLNYDMSAAAQLPGADEVLPALTDVCAQTCLCEAVSVSRQELAERLLSALLDCCANFSRRACARLERFSRDYDVCRGRMIDILQQQGDVISGRAAGVNHRGELLVEIEGSLRSFNSAEVSLKLPADIAGEAEPVAGRAEP